MSRTIGFSVTGLTAAAALGVSVASDKEFGEFTTLVAEDRLFMETESGSILRCDLFFSLPGMEPAVAPKGSEVGQAIPPVVWQYSGLLPVADYLKSIVIHSVATEEKIRPWQEVQHLFYNGLRAEGANIADAKIAFAGAYAFAPRWTLVEFVEVEEDNIFHPESILYEVKYVEPSTKGMSLQGYRALALQILDDAEEITLQDIRSVVDAEDSAKADASDRASLGGIGGTQPQTVYVPNLPVIESEEVPTEPEMISGIKTSSGAPVMDSGQRAVNDTAASAEQPEPTLESLPELPESADTSGVPVELPVMELPVAEPEEQALADSGADPDAKVMASSGISTSSGALLMTGDQRAVSKTADKMLSPAESADSENVSMSETITTPVESESLPVSELFVDDLTDNNEQLPKPELPVESAELVKPEVADAPAPMPVSQLFYDDSANIASMPDPDVKPVMSEPEAKPASPEVTVPAPLPVKDLFYDDRENPVSNEDLDLEDVAGAEDEWVILPDGTMVLRNVEKLVSE